jgi:HAD superfamily phosphatase (TIGR01668 family)
VFRPDAYAPRISAISLERLAAENVHALIFDLDNTSVGYGSDDIPEDIMAWILEARERGFSLALVSNNFTARVQRVSNELGVFAIAGALKPLPNGFLRALHVLGTAKAQTVVIGDQIFTDCLGARLAGLRMILTEPLESHDWAGTRVLRFLERVMMGRR